MQNPIGDMLTLTRLESVDYPMRPEPVDIASMLRNLLLEAEVLSVGKHTFSLSIDGPDIIGSKDELRGAFSNLIFNVVRLHAGWRKNLDHVIVRSVRNWWSRIQASVSVPSTSHV